MTKSINLEFGDWATPIVSRHTVDFGDYQYQQPKSSKEVVIVNSSGSTLYLGDDLAYDNGWGVPLPPGAGITLSLGPSDVLYGYADGTIILPVMILENRGR